MSGATIRAGIHPVPVPRHRIIQVLYVIAGVALVGGIAYARLHRTEPEVMFRSIITPEDMEAAAANFWLPILDGLAKVLRITGLTLLAISVVCAAIYGAIVTTQFCGRHLVATGIVLAAVGITALYGVWSSSYCAALMARHTAPARLTSPQLVTSHDEWATGKRDGVAMVGGSVVLASDPAPGKIIRLRLPGQTGDWRVVGSSPAGDVWASSMKPIGLAHSADAGKTWQYYAPPTLVRAVCGISATEAWWFGNGGLIVHLNWSQKTELRATSDDLYGACQVDGMIWAVGDNGTALQIDRTSGQIKLMALGTPARLESVYARQGDDVWAVGYATRDQNVWGPGVWHYDGMRWYEKGGTSFNTGVVAQKQGVIVLNHEGMADTHMQVLRAGKWGGVGPAIPTREEITQAKLAGDDSSLLLNLVYKTSGRKVYVQTAGNWQQVGLHAGEDLAYISATGQIRPHGTLILPFTPDGARHHWVSIRPQQDLPAGTAISYRFSTDGKSWYNEVSQLPPSMTLYILVELRSAGQSTPRLDALAISWD